MPNSVVMRFRLAQYFEPYRCFQSEQQRVCNDETGSPCPILHEWHPSPPRDRSTTVQPIRRVTNGSEIGVIPARCSQWRAARQKSAHFCISSMTVELAGISYSSSIMAVMG